MVAFGKKEGFSKRERLRKQRDFERVFKLGKKVWIDALALMIYAQNSLGYRRLGVVVSKKIRKAYQRNKVKRWIREVFRRNKDMFPESSDIIIIPHPRLVEKSYAELLSEFKKNLLRRENSFHGKKADSTAN